MAHQVGLDPARFRFKARFRKNGLRVGDVPVDLVELTPRFPKRAKHEHKIVTWLFGPKATLALAVVGDRVVWTAGRDWRPRIAAMIDAARGEATVRSMAEQPTFVRATRSRRGLVSLSFLATSPLAGFVLEALRVSEGQLDPIQQVALAPFASSPTMTIVTHTRAWRDGDRAVYELRTRVPAEVIRDIGMIGGAMWRVGFAPILGPPPTPPLPAPPPTITPPATEPAPAEQTPGHDHPPVQPPSPDLPAGRGA